MLREVLSRIIGERADAQTSTAVKDAVRSVPGVLGAYDLVLDDYGPDQLQGSVHVEVPESMNAIAIDALTRQIQQKVYAQTSVILHTVGVYSTNENSPTAAQMHAHALHLAEGDDHIAELHGFFVGEENRHVRLDAVVDFGTPDRPAVIERMRAALQERYPDYTFHITMDSDISD